MMGLPVLPQTQVVAGAGRKHYVRVDVIESGEVESLSDYGEHVLPSVSLVEGIVAGDDLLLDVIPQSFPAIRFCPVESIHLTVWFKFELFHLFESYSKIG